CLRAAGALIKYLDQSTFCSDHKKDSCGVVVFRKELLKLTSDVRVFNFLRELNEQFGHLHFLPDFRMDLWQLAVRFAGSEDEAIQWLAVLFQDTANTRFHLRWLAKQRLNRVQRVILGELGEA